MNVPSSVDPELPGSVAREAACCFRQLHSLRYALKEPWCPRVEESVSGDGGICWLEAISYEEVLSDVMLELCMVRDCTQEVGSLV